VIFIKVFRKSADKFFIMAKVFFKESFLLKLFVIASDQRERGNRKIALIMRLLRRKLLAMTLADFNKTASKNL